MHTILGAARGAKKKFMGLAGQLAVSSARVWRGFCPRVRQVGVRCAALLRFPSPSPSTLVSLCSQPRFPACSCQLSCSLEKGRSARSSSNRLFYGLG